MSPDSSRARKFISGRMKLLKKVSTRATRTPNIRGERMIDKKLIPEERMALISLSSDILPKVIRLASSTAMGTERAIIQARFKNRYSRIVPTSRPLPRKRSMARSRKLMKSTKVIISREKIKGRIVSRTRYLDNSRMVEITISRCLQFMRNSFNSKMISCNFPGFISEYSDGCLYGGCSSAG